MKVNIELVVGIVITAVSVYYWVEINGSSFSSIPIFFRFTYRLLPYFDVAITAAGLWELYSGIKKLRE